MHCRRRWCVLALIVVAPLVGACQQQNGAAARPEVERSQGTPAKQKAISLRGGNNVPKIHPRVLFHATSSVYSRQLTHDTSSLFPSTVAWPGLKSTLGVESHAL
jgi:hypothetical protein